MKTPIRSTRFFCAACLLLAAILPAAAQTPPDPSPDLRPEMLSSDQWLPGRIAVSLRQPDGRVLVGGTFNRVAGSIPRNHLLRLNADGSLDMDFAPAFASSTEMEVRALAVAGDAIYVGGAFETVDGVPRLSLARLRLDGSLDTAFASPFSSTTANDVAALALTPAGLFVGGDLLDHDAYGLVRLDPATGAWDPSWSAPTRYAPGSASRGEVHALAAIEGDLLVGGEFGEIAGVARNGLARISQAAPVAVRALDGGIAGTVHAIERDGNRLYVGGDFFRAVGSGPNYLNRLDAGSGALDAGWAPAPNGAVYALHLVGGTLYVGGTFTGVVPGGARLARVPVRGAGAFDPTWNPSADDTVRALADTCRGHLLAGGNYGTISGQTRDGLAAFAIPEIDCLFADGFEPR